jgi:hypothetical protein
MTVVARGRKKLRGNDPDTWCAEKDLHKIHETEEAEMVSLSCRNRSCNKTFEKRFPHGPKLSVYGSRDTAFMSCAAWNLKKLMVVYGKQATRLVARLFRSFGFIKQFVRSD